MVPSYDWAGFFEVPFKQTALKGIKSKFEAAQPGIVVVQEGADKPGRQLKLLADPSWRPRAQQLLPIITPAGLPEERVA